MLARIVRYLAFGAALFVPYGLASESGSAGSRTNGRSWLVDPIWGTASFDRPDLGRAGEEGRISQRWTLESPFVSCFDNVKPPEL